MSRTLNDSFSAELNMLEAELERYLPPCENHAVVAAMRHSLLGGGKRLRGLLTLLFCRAAGGHAQGALPYACAIEMIHAYSLIHDDLPCMDDSPIRRGRPSCHVAFGEATALLAGDGLLTLAFEAIACSQLPTAAQAVHTLAVAAGHSGMIGGQMLDLAERDNNFEQQVILSEQKTGALLMASAVLGCLAAGADERMLNAAEGYAAALGLAFQVQDDILDVTGSSAKLGKPTGSDEKNSRPTFYTLLGPHGAHDYCESLYRTAATVLDGVFGGTGAAELLLLLDILVARAS